MDKKFEVNQHKLKFSSPSVWTTVHLFQVSNWCEVVCLCLSVHLLPSSSCLLLCLPAHPCPSLPISLLTGLPLYPSPCSGEDKEANSDQVPDASSELGRSEAKSNQRDCVQWHWRRGHPSGKDIHTVRQVTYSVSEWNYQRQKRLIFTSCLVLFIFSLTR